MYLEPEPRTILGSANLGSLYTPSGRFDTDAAYPGGLSNVHSLWDRMATLFPDHKAFLDPAYKVSMTYSEATTAIEKLAGQLQAAGLDKGDKISVFSENSHKWLLLDGAVLKCGAVNVVRGVAAPLEELEYIMKDSGSVACIVQNVDLLKRLGPVMARIDKPPSFVLVIDSDGLSEAELKSKGSLPDTGIAVKTFKSLIEAGEPSCQTHHDILNFPLRDHRRLKALPLAACRNMQCVPSS